MHAQWVPPALFGAGTGALALAIVGFSWGGWVTASGAQRMSSDAAAIAVAASLTPYCLERSKSDPLSAGILADIKIARAFQRAGLVEQAGWATPLGEERPNRQLAAACGQALTAQALPFQ
jgi:alpha/beta superfamily hydrolase